jgi:uncharacterized membrane protein (DUF485 family)
VDTEESRPPGLTDDALSATFTALALVPSFAYLLALALAPRWLAAPISADSLVTRGLAFGLGLAAFLVVVSVVYTVVRNRREPAS